MAVRVVAALVLLAAAAHGQYPSTQYPSTSSTQGSTSPTSSTTYSLGAGGLTANPSTYGSQSTTSTGAGLSGNLSSALTPASQAIAGTGIGSGVASSPGAGLTYTPSNTLGRSSGAQASAGPSGYSSFTPASSALGTTGTGATYSPRVSSATLPTQTQNPYSYGPTVYVPVAGSGSAAAPGPMLMGPATAPAAGPLAAGPMAAGPSTHFGAAPAPGPTALGPVAAQAAQNTSFGETQLTGVGPIYKKQDSLEPFYANLYGIPVPVGQKDPDIFITLEVLGGGTTDVGLYCNPGWGQYADVNANYPQPGYAVWQSDLSNDVDTVFISKNDRLYRPPYAREPNTTAYANYQPYFICAVINQDSQRQVSYRLEADLINNQGGLSRLEQRALSNIFSDCCVGGASVCTDWKTRNAKEGKVFTDWCSYPGQICTANGTLLRLDMRGFNLQCPFPAADLAVFTSVTTLNLGRNPNLTGAAVDVFSSLANAQGLRHLNLYQNAGITGPMVPPLSAAGGALCQMVRRGLTSLTADGVGLTGTLPSCLLSTGSKLVELHLGNNNLTGIIPNQISASSALQVLTLYNNQLSGTIPASIGNAQQLSNFDITNNAITGTIPASLGNITTLKYAILKFNKLSGAIPSSLATNVNLETLDVKGNRLSILPTEWIVGYDSVVNSSLVNVRISFNNFTGPFPSALQQAPQLTFLVINNNTLSGALPGGQGNNTNTTDFFPALRAFNASHNAFSGTLPAAWGNSGVFKLSPLQFADGEILMHVFDISFNRLSGPLPSFLDFTNVPEYTQRGIYISGNNFTYSCTAQVAYINDICLTSAAMTPTRLPPLGMSTPAARTATGGLPATNVTLPASNASQPDSLTYPDGSYPNTPVTLPGNSPGSATAQPAGSPVNIHNPQPQSGKKPGLSGGQIAGICIGVLLALALAGLVSLLAVRRLDKRVAGAPMGGGKAGALNSFKLGGGGNKFERFDDGLQMSESTRRMEGFGSGR